MEKILKFLGELVQCVKVENETNYPYVDFEMMDEKTLGLKKQNHKIDTSTFSDLSLQDVINLLEVIGESVWGFNNLVLEKDEEHRSRQILSRCLMASNFIATSGRIGPAQYVLVNPFLHEKLSKMVGAKTINDKLFVGGLMFIETDLVSPNKFIVMRKTTSTQAGVKFLYTDKLSEIATIGKFPSVVTIEVK